MKKDFSVKEYSSINEVFLSSFEIDCESLSTKDLQELKAGCLDSDNNEIDISFEKFKESIEEQGIWGWVDENKVIHCWVGKNLPLEDLIHFFAHEIGHRTGKPNKDFLKEELRAEEFGNVSVLSYKFAKQLKSKKT